MNYIIIVIAIIILIYISQWIFGAPYSPTLKRKLISLVKLAEAKPGDKIVDLGSGDGRIVITFALEGAEAHGFEINPLLVLWSRWKIIRAGLRGKAYIHWGNFLKADLSSYDIIILFQFKTYMKTIGDKIERELKPTGKVVSNVWQFPSWNHKRVCDKIYVYEKS